MGAIAQGPGKIQQEPVPCPVSLGVVDLLQVVQIEIPDRQHPAAVSAFARMQMLQIVKSGQGISDFTITYSPRIAPGVEGGYFEISYIITSELDSSRTRMVNTIVRVMND